MSKPPTRFKPREDWSVDEILKNQRTGTVPESDEYRQARRKALTDAGFEHDDDAATPIEEMTPDQHAKRQGRTQ